MGDFKNGGQEWEPNGEPVATRVHDFIDDKLGKVTSYGIYDIGRNDAWVNVGATTTLPNSPSPPSSVGGRPCAPRST